MKWCFCMLVNLKDFFHSRLYVQAQNMHKRNLESKPCELRNINGIWDTKTLVKSCSNINWTRMMLWRSFILFLLFCLDVFYLIIMCLINSNPVYMALFFRRVHTLVHHCHSHTELAISVCCTPEITIKYTTTAISFHTRLKFLIIYYA